MGGPSEAVPDTLPSKLGTDSAAHRESTGVDSNGPSQGASDDLERGFVPPVLHAQSAGKASNANRCALKGFLVLPTPVWSLFEEILPPC
jgi:hypothetical protein